MTLQISKIVNMISRRDAFLRMLLSRLLRLAGINWFSSVSALTKLLNVDYSSLIIHDVMSQQERPIRVRWMTLKLNETPVQSHQCFITFSSLVFHVLK